MGLLIMVGVLAGGEDVDPAFTAPFHNQIVVINKLLAAEGLPPHVEPAILPKLENRSVLHSFPYAYLHYLRRVAAHQLQNPHYKATPVEPDEDPANDPAIALQFDLFQNHLICLIFLIPF